MQAVGQRFDPVILHQMNDPYVEHFEGFEILWDPQGHFVNFNVYIEGETENYLQGFVKWDGCTELKWAKYHFCGGQSIAAHILLLQHLYTEAFTYMDSCQVDDPIPLTIVRT